jgi:hypothetical protein
MRYLLTILFAGALTACSLTIEDREAIRDTGFNLAIVAVEALQTVGLTPLEDIDPDVLKYAQAGCTMLAASSPLIVQAINNVVDNHNEGLAADAQTDRTTVAEFTAGLEAICILVEQILAPEPEISVAPAVAPIPVPRPPSNV